MSKFKVGDKIKGNKYSDTKYNITDSHFTGYVDLDYFELADEENDNTKTIIMDDLSISESSECYTTNLYKELFEKYVKGDNDMNKILEIYKNRKIEEINNVLEEQVEKEYNEIELVKEYNDIVKDFEEKMETLLHDDRNFGYYYISEYNSRYIYKYSLNSCIENDIISKYKEETENAKEELNRLVEEVEAHLSMSDDLEYQRKVLKDYGILDKKTGKINA